MSFSTQVIFDKHARLCNNGKIVPLLFTIFTEIQFLDTHLITDQLFSNLEETQTISISRHSNVLYLY